MSIAPIVLFVYNRLSHTRRTIDSLRKNKLAEVSELFVYSDHAKDADSKIAVQEVRDYISQLKGFKQIQLYIERKILDLLSPLLLV